MSEFTKRHAGEVITESLSRLRTPVNVSFEFFPPNDARMEETLWSSIQHLAPLRPRFVSVTYGADGSTRERTRDVVSRILEHTDLTAVPHLTCVGASREEVLDLARAYWAQGIRHLVALRGDPSGGSALAPDPNRFAYAADLVRGLRSVGDFDISVAAYPEKHPEAPDAQFDLDNLKAKFDAGASRAITQFFFDIDAYLRFRDRCAAAGIEASIVPGILPITRFPQLQRFAERCGTTIPAHLAHRFDGLDDDLQTRQMISCAVALEQVHALQRHGVHEFHFYTLNRSELTYAICHALGVRATADETQARRAAG